MSTSHLPAHYTNPDHKDYDSARVARKPIRVSFATDTNSTEQSDFSPAPTTSSSAADFSSAESLNIFLADDHACVREGLRNLIDSQPDMQVVGEAEDGEKAWNGIRQLCRENTPSGTNPSPAVDVVVMDISMPNVNGVEATQAIRQAYPNIKVIALSMHEDKSYLRELFSAGANGYVLKRSASTELIHAIRLVAGGDTYLDPRLADKVVESLGSRSEPRDEEKGFALSEREKETLSLIAHGFTNKEISDQMTLSIKTVETYKARGMEKLGLVSRAEIVRYALQQGWLETK